MKFLNIVERLQKSEEGKDKIIIVRCGAFFVGVGKDAVTLSTLLGLRTTCMKIGVCKVGIPINAMLKYIDELERIGHSFLIYDYEKDKKAYTLKYSFEGVSAIEEDTSFSCKSCEYYKTNARYENLDIFELLEEKKKLEKDIHNNTNNILNKD